MERVVGNLTDSLIIRRHAAHAHAHEPRLARAGVPLLTYANNYKFIEVGDQAWNFSLPRRKWHSVCI
jgi:hypothetical protein